MAGGKRRGRGWSALRAQTPQAQELAQFLRDLMDQHGWTTRKLGEVVSYGKSTIADNLDGRVPSEKFVLEVVNTVVTEPRKRARDLAQARRLWQAADNPPPPPPVGTSPPSQELALVEKTTNQLIDVYDRNAELEAERANSHQLVLVLLRLVAHLNSRVEELAARPGDAEKLAVLNEQLRIAKQELERARLARQEAELLAARAQQETVALQEQLAAMREAAPPEDVNISVTVRPATLPPELEEEHVLADVNRALRAAEGFLQEGAQRRERITDDIESDSAPTPQSPQRVGEGWLLVALATGRTLGCVLMMTGAAVHYGLSTSVTTSELVLGLPDLLVFVGIVLLLDPWDIVFDSLGPYLTGLLTGERIPLVWPFTAHDLISRAMRVPWGAAAAAATVLSLATVYWWPLWLLAATVPTALGTMTYAITGRNRRVVDAGTAFISQLTHLRHPLPAAPSPGAASRD